MGDIITSISDIVERLFGWLTKSEFTKTKFVILSLVTILLTVCIIVGYSWFTTRELNAKMEFEVEYIKKLSDPEIKKNIQGDPLLEESHNAMKIQLKKYSEETLNPISSGLLQFFLGFYPLLFFMRLIKEGGYPALILFGIINGCFCYFLIPPSWPVVFKYVVAPWFLLILLGVLSSILGLKKLTSQKEESQIP